MYNFYLMVQWAQLEVMEKKNMFIANFLCICYEGVALRIKMNYRYSLTCFLLYLKEVHLIRLWWTHVIIDDSQIPVLKTHLYIEYNSLHKTYYQKYPIHLYIDLRSSLIHTCLLLSIKYCSMNRNTNIIRQ